MPNPKTQATPGPCWRIIERVVDGRTIAGVFDVIDGASGAIVAANVWAPHRFTIAAAPQMREALEELLREEKRDDGDPILDAARIKARAALRAAGSEE